LPSHLAKPAIKLVAEAGIEPAADEAYETSALPTELFRGVRLKWLPLLGSNQALRGQSPVPYQLGEGAIRLVPRAGFEPAPSDLKDRRPRPLDERGDIGAGSENRTRVFCLEGSGSAIELRPLWRMVQGSNLRDPKVSTR
jgi:hypothetical protein